ncbi:hypothetical protein VKT23_008576 [Stygiomarasmius scandens]|uniref:Zinc finger PHD-type domain-containing protein n=1 Tax=Marasmiellus scandens TaxID=2682957 RepID=A0ABR1JL31_9AGAR
MTKGKGKKKAGRSTGAKAPRKSLGSLPEPSTADDSIRAVKRRKANVAHDSESDSSASDEVHEEQSLDYQTDFAKTPQNAQWCSGCDDDTETPKATCATCKHIVCYGPQKSGACLELTKKAVTNPPWSCFVCPACEYLTQQHPGSKNSQFRYIGFYNSDGEPITKIILSIRNRQFSFFKPLKLEKLALVQLRCAGIHDDFDLPFQITVLRASAFASGVVTVSEVLKHRLQSPHATTIDFPSQPQPLLTATITFNLATETGMNQHSRQMLDLMNSVEAMGITRIMFLLVTHADPERGDLHYAAEGAGAERLEVVMKELFPPTIQEWLIRKENYLFMLVCGSKPLTQPGYNYLQNQVTRRVFQNIFLFPSSHLQPHEITFFLTNFVELALYRHDDVETATMLALKNLHTLGLHTRILHVSSCSDKEGKPSCKAERYVWCHRSRRPWGVETPTFCPTCNSVKTFVNERLRQLAPNNGYMVVFKCQGQTGDTARLCTNQVTVPLTSSELNLNCGPKGKLGEWQKHAFKWDLAILERF